MSYVSEIQKPAAFSPFVLRVAVAGVLAYCGYQTFTTAHPQRETDAAAIEASQEITSLDQSTESPDWVENAASPEVSPAITHNGSVVVAKRKLSASRVLGFAEMNLALMLAAGLLVRIMSLAGLGAVVTGGLGASGYFADQQYVGMLADVFNASPAAALLFGAVCLGLLFSGAGRFSFDRILNRRRHRQPIDAAMT